VNARQARRARATDDLIDHVALEELAVAHGGRLLEPVAIVIAAYKEADTIESVVKAMPSEIEGLATSVVVVVDGEDDGTSGIVRNAGQVAVIAPVNRGQGAALRLGYRVAREYGARFIVTADADGQSDPDDLAAALRPVVAGEADFVNGSRRLGETYGTDTVRNAGVLCYAVLVSLLTRTRVTDTANPIRAFRSALTGNLTLEEPQYQASELLIAAIMSGCRYAEIPVTMRERAAGSSKKGGNLLYGLRYGRVVLRTWHRERARRRNLCSGGARP
jgi:glycosyltransferase involved in cell wall biosynthesis